jgi:hypothetical protein
VIVDHDKANRKAWGHGMWPSVHVLDKQGCMRGFWAGELKWQGRDAETLVQKKMEALPANK